MDTVINPSSVNRYFAISSLFLIKVSQEDSLKLELYENVSLAFLFMICQIKLE